MTQFAFEASLFVFIAGNFTVCVLAVARPWLMEAFRKPPQHQAVIIPFARPSRRGGRQ